MSNWSWAEQLPGGILEDLLPHPLTVARALANQELVLAYRHVFRSGRYAFPLQDELCLLLTGEEGLTVQLTLSLSARPTDFIMMVYGTRATLRVDLRNMLLAVSHSGTGPLLFRRGLGVTRSALQVLFQTAHNAIRSTLPTFARPGDPWHLIRSHYHALEEGAEVPAPIARAKLIVKIARDIWPLASA